MANVNTVQTVRLKGVILPSNKHIYIALLSIFGVGQTRSKHICNVAGVPESKKVYQLNSTELKSLQDEVEKFMVEGDLRREVSLKRKRLRDIRCYRGLRDARNLPRRGQRTRTNARTCKGPKGNRIKQQGK
ncbi:MAG: 30S ribosomal protein S13 [Pseudomonadota bacterium]